MKYFLFIPFMIYQFLKKRNKTDSDAYMNSILIFFIYTFLYTFFLIPQSVDFLFIIINKISTVLGFSTNNKLVKYAFFIILTIPFFALIRKKRLDTIKFNDFEYKIAYVLTGFILWFPIALFIFLLIKLLLVE